MPHRVKYDHHNKIISYDDPVLGEIWDTVINGAGPKTEEGKIEYSFNERIRRDLPFLKEEIK
jgi:hypothetical protein